MNSNVGSPEDGVSFRVKAIKVQQPIGEFFIASIPHHTLYDICYFDVRRMLKERDIEEYLGIQRPLNEKRAEELKQYVRTIDACFPTSIVLAIDKRCATFHMDSGELELKNHIDENGDHILYRQIAKVLDGQHRIAGLADLQRETQFDLNVSIFVDIEIEDQAYIFSIVNLAQTKVNKSLAYDLFELATARSPQKTAHNVAVALDRTKGSPFEKRIKRLGSATPGREGEVLTQATVVEGILPLISRTPMVDRDVLKRKGRLPQPSHDELARSPLRNYFVMERDVEIVNIIWNYFDAVSQRWPSAWNDRGRGAVLTRTNGFRALIRVFPSIYKMISKITDKPLPVHFLRYFNDIQLEDSDFNVDRFVPGSSGESSLAKELEPKLNN